MKELHISTETGGESVIFCGNGSFESKLPALLADYPEKILFTDSNVFPIYKEKIAKICPDIPVHVMPAGEEHKTPETLLALLSAMAQAGLHRSGCLVALGGGVVGDIGGLASALYMRGIACIQVPTTLLAQVDSSVGGKTAVDFAGVKNLIGVFKQPEYVIADAEFLKTLPARELRCGLGEIIKHSALDGALFDKICAGENHLTDLAFLAGLVPDNIAIKASVVEQDAREAGLRKCLNLGHTTAHALELTHKTLSHGEYVLIGTVFEAELAKRHVSCDEAYLNELERIALRALGEMPKLPDPMEAARLALLDKKNVAAREIVITAPTAKGKYRLIALPFETYARELVAIQEALC